MLQLYVPPQILFPLPETITFFNSLHCILSCLKTRTQIRTGGRGGGGVPHKKWKKTVPIAVSLEQRGHASFRCEMHTQAFPTIFRSKIEVKKTIK